MSKTETAEIESALLGLKVEVDYQRSDDASRHVKNALSGAGAIRRLAEEITKLRVIEARAAGMSWAEIGEELVLSRQAVWERYRAVTA